MMIRRVIIGVVISLFLIELTTVEAANRGEEDQSLFQKEAERLKYESYPLPLPGEKTDRDCKGGETESLGFERIISNSPGAQVGLTTWDMQSICRNNRQVDWRGARFVHFTWARQTDSTYGGNRGIAYEAADTVPEVFIFNAPFGGCDIHPRCGWGVDYSGFVGLDIDTESKAVIGLHRDDGSGFATSVMYDFVSASCFFSPYRRDIPDSLSQYGLSPEDIAAGDWRFLYPSIEYQVYDGDTVTHVFGYQFIPEDVRSSQVHYFRRVGSDTLGYWEYPPVVIDTIPVISQTVTSSRQSGKVALVWMAPPGAYPGDPESMTRDWVDPGLGTNERTNEIYYMTSNDMGATWGNKHNITGFDSTQGGWLGHGDLSCLIASDDILHIVWPAREVIPSGSGLGEFAHFFGSRMFHYDESYNMVRTVADANWDLPDSSCHGGTWNEMAMVKPMISECDGKFYTFYVQFQDIRNGIYDDCAERRYSSQYSFGGTANGEIYVSVSTDNGFSWSMPYNLTNTYTPYCYPDEAEGVPVCESDHYVSAARFGMPADTATFEGIPIIDPVGAPGIDHYLDVTYINDKFPGSCTYNDAVWTMNPYKWFRLACFEPYVGPCIQVWPWEIGILHPAWVQPGNQKDTVIHIYNNCNAALNISGITTATDQFEGWLEVGEHGSLVLNPGESYDLPVYLNHNGLIATSPHIVEGEIIIDSDDPVNPQVNIPVKLIIAGNVPGTVWTEIETACTRLTFSNSGNAGHTGRGGMNLDYVGSGLDCDTTGNEGGDDDNAAIYLYDASPFLSWIDGADTMLYNAVFDADWLNENGFRPLDDYPMVDDTGHDDYQYGCSGWLITQDTSLGLTLEYYAPTHPDSCDFIVIREKVFNMAGEEVHGVMVGDIGDWDIPSDSGVRNQSDYDDSLQAVYLFGFEYADDSIANNDCVLADQRLGGYAFYGGYRNTSGSIWGEFTSPQAQWTDINADWVYPTGNFVPEQLYQRAVTASGYEVWEATADFTNPDSMAQDLHHVAIVGQFDIGVNDTLIYVKILAGEYDGGEEAFKATIAKARAWIEGRPEIYDWPYPPPCYVEGDVNFDWTVNMLDVTYLIAYLYQGGPPPYKMNHADVNADCGANILDITYLIAYLYQSGPEPLCGCAE